MLGRELAAGDTIGEKYRITRMLGRGGMGIVFEAENLYTRRSVAIKCLQTRDATSSARERLLREAQAAARIRHHNVVDLYDVVFEQDAVFLVMELLNGETLGARLEREALPVPNFLRLMVQAMRGVASAHREKIIHRDIKPDNIFLANEDDHTDPVPKILDFGIAKLDGADVITHSGHTLGTPLYMSFEQLRGQRDLDARADVYAFGIILYAALTGRPPYSGASLPELVYHITTVEPLPPRALRSELPEALSACVMRAIAKERDQRTASLQGLIDELKPFCEPTAGVSELLTQRGRREQTTRGLDAVESTPRAEGTVHKSVALSTPEPVTTPAAWTQPKPSRWTPRILAGAVLAAGLALAAFFTLRAPERTATETPPFAPAPTAAAEADSGNGRAVTMEEPAPAIEPVQAPSSVGIRQVEAHDTRSAVPPKTRRRAAPAATPTVIATEPPPAPAPAEAPAANPTPRKKALRLDDFMPAPTP